MGLHPLKIARDISLILPKFMGFFHQSISVILGHAKQNSRNFLSNGSAGDLFYLQMRDLHGVNRQSAKGCFLNPNPSTNLVGQKKETM